LAWKTEPDSAIQHAGIVKFTDNGDETTTIHLRMTYNPPAGALAHGLASLVGSDPKTLLDEDLMRMKSATRAASPRLSSKQFPKLVFCAFQHLFLPRAQSPASAIEIEIQHRHGGLIGLGLAPWAGFSGSLERRGNFPWAGPGENALVEVERVAVSGYLTGSASLRRRSPFCAWRHTA
jgi:hypothetical protein